MMDEIVADRPKGPSFEWSVVPRAHIDHVAVWNLQRNVVFNERPSVALPLDFDELVVHLAGVVRLQIALDVLQNRLLLVLDFQVVGLLQMVQVRKGLLGIQRNEMQHIQDVRPVPTI